MFELPSSPDGGTVYAGGDATLVSCSVQGRQVSSLAREVSALDVTPDGRSLVVLSGGKLLLIDPSTWRIERTLVSSAAVTAFALSPDANRIAIGHDDGSVEVHALSALVSR